MTTETFAQAADDHDRECEQDIVDITKAVLAMTNAVAFCLVMSHSKHDGAKTLSTSVIKDLYKTACAFVPLAKQNLSKTMPSKILAECTDNKLWPLALTNAFYHINKLAPDGGIPGHDVRIFDMGDDFPEDWKGYRAVFAQYAETMLMDFIVEGTKKIETVINCTHEINPALLPEVVDLAREADLFDKPFEVWFTKALSRAYDQNYRYGSLPAAVSEDDDIHKVLNNQPSRLMYN